MHPKENEILREKEEELLRKGHFQASISTCAVPTLLTLKKYRSWHICVNSRVINQITIGYLIPRLDDVFDQLSEEFVFSNIELKGGYHPIKILLGDMWKTTFKTRDDHRKL